MIAQKLITVGENENTVFRSCKDGIHTNVFETICAFLNTRGGTLLLGVDESGEVYGFKERAIPDIIQALKMATQNADTFQPPFEMEPVREIVDGKYVLVLNVPESANVHALRGKIFVRRGTENIRVERKEDYLEIVVMDDGVGMEEEQVRIMQETLEPIRNRRKEFEKDIPAIYDMLKKGCETARETAAATLDDVRKAMKINYFDDAELIAEQVKKFGGE